MFAELDVSVNLELDIAGIEGDVTLSGDIERTGLEQASVTAQLEFEGNIFTHESDLVDPTQVTLSNHNDIEMDLMEIDTDGGSRLDGVIRYQGAVVANIDENDTAVVIRYEDEMGTFESF
jgi:hypothetical protein